MNSILLACLLTAVAFLVAGLKNKFKDMPAALILIMISIDLMVVYGFYQLDTPNLQISIGIAMATPLKVFIFMISQEDDE